jgi:hypothetical protein
MDRPAAAAISARLGFHRCSTVNLQIDSSAVYLTDH